MAQTGAFGVRLLSGKNPIDINIPDFGISEKLFGVGKYATQEPRSNGQVLSPTNNRLYTPAQQTSTPTYTPNASYGYSSVNQSTGGGSNRGGFTENGTYYGSQDEFNQANPNYRDNSYDDYMQAEEERQQAELQGLNTEYDRTSEELRGQIPFLEQKRERGLSGLRSAVDEARGTVENSKLSARTRGEEEIQQAGDTARNTQRSTRNTLRALGILGSSAAGELLSKPLNEFDKVRAGVNKAVTQRVNELETFLNTKTQENTNLIGALEDQYAQLVGNIQRDLRFNERDRADSIRNANASLRSRLSEIQQAQMAYEQQVKAEKQNLALSLAQMSNYQMPEADLRGILSSAFNPGGNMGGSQTASIYQDEKKRLSSMV